MDKRKKLAELAAAHDDAYGRALRIAQEASEAAQKVWAIRDEYDKLKSEVVKDTLAELAPLTFGSPRDRDLLDDAADGLEKIRR